MNYQPQDDYMQTPEAQYAYTEHQAIVALEHLAEMGGLTAVKDVVSGFYTKHLQEGGR